MIIQSRNGDKSAESPFYQVVEHFVSINGEGLKAGELAHFIRLKTCNLSCFYCDTAWANADDCPAEKLTLEGLMEIVRLEGVKNVTLTGGEPLFREGMVELTLALMDEGYHVEIETNGSVDLSEFFKLRLLRRADLIKGEPGSLSLTVDYKLPGSGQSSRMYGPNYLGLTTADAVKFVASSEGDLEEALRIIRQFELLDRTHVYLSTAFGDLSPAQAVDFMKNHGLNGVRLQLQLHKYIWDPMMKGV